MTSPNLAGLISGLAVDILKLPRRVEPIGGQRCSYVTLGDVLALVEQAGESAALRTVSDELGAGWRSMESAPKNGRHCILSVPHGSFYYSVQGVYQDGKWHSVIANDVQPVAWMPNVLLPDHLRPDPATDPAMPDTQSREGDQP